VSPLLLDGAMGTALIDCGLPPGALPERWLLERPDAIAAVHASHAAAGARILLTSTFNLAGPRLRAAGVEASLEELARRAVQLARDAAPSLRVAGALGPTMLAAGVDRAELRERYAAPFQALATAGADLLWTESCWLLEEARASLAAARSTGKPVVATVGVRLERGVLRCGSGQPALECLEALAMDGATAVGVNCALPGDPLDGLFRAAAVRLNVPLVAKPSAGLPGHVLAPASFAAWIGELAQAGAAWVGGCCGASAAHVAACARFLSGSPQPRG
jgi:5-methyltetrahydrofolate--homocysteine methyltransferase